MENRVWAGKGQRLSPEAGQEEDGKSRPDRAEEDSLCEVLDD